MCLTHVTGPGVWAQSGLYVAPEFFYWNKTLHGLPDVTEAGIRAVLGYRVRQDREQGGVVFPCDFHVYGGVAELGIGYQWRLPAGYSLTPYVSIAGELWVRKLNGGADAAKNSVGGYNEIWWTFPLRVGLELAPRECGWMAGLDIKAPLYTENDVDFSGTSSVQMKTLPSGGGEFGYRFNKRWAVLGYFDSYWFGRSNVADGMLQPTSIMLIAGIKTLVSF